jgi:hypothetical protein
VRTTLLIAPEVRDKLERLAIAMRMVGGRGCNPPREVGLTGFTGLRTLFRQPLGLGAGMRMRARDCRQVTRMAPRRRKISNPTQNARGRVR